MSSISQPLRISASTRISTIIRANPAAIEAIASINKHFEKLRNPLLRKVLASRVTLADAARIGGTEVNVFFEKLKSLGFVPDKEEGFEEAPVASSRPQFPPVGFTLDVRETLEKGQDPFKEILAAAERLPDTQSLLILNTFEPVPLVEVLRKKGFAHFTSPEAPNLVYTYFYRSGQAGSLRSNPEKKSAAQNPAAGFEDLRRQYQDNLVQIDVRNLEMPLPMITILENITALGPKQALLVHHCRVPQYLLPQLTERGFGFAIAEPVPGEVKLLIYKTDGHEPDNS